MFAGLGCTVKVILMLDGNRRVMYSCVCPTLFPSLQVGVYRE